MARREEMPKDLTLSQLIISLQQTLDEVGDVPVRISGPLHYVSFRMVRDKSTCKAIVVEDGHLFLEG
jgi:hypothetical protein